MGVLCEALPLDKAAKGVVAWKNADSQLYLFEVPWEARLVLLEQFLDMFDAQDPRFKS